MGAASADDAVAGALLAKKNPVLAGALDEAQARGRTEGLAEGRTEGLARALVRLLEARFGPPGATVLAQIAAGTELELLEWVADAAKVDSLEAVFGP